MIDPRFLYKGICGMARAHQANQMAGHLGAALVAGYFFGKDHPGLDDQVYTGVEKELDRVLAGEEDLWFDAKKAGITINELFEPFPNEQPHKEQVALIAEALSGNINKPRQSGHNVIFAALAIRAFQEHPEYATPSIIEGTRKLIAGFNDAVPGRGYYGPQHGWLFGDQVTLPVDDGSSPYKEEGMMAEVVVDELIHSASIRRRGFGGLVHVVNHAAGLTDLSRLGYPDLTQKGLAAHYLHLRLLRSLPDVEEELGAVEQAAHDPRTTSFWTTETLKRDSAQLTHRIKVLYGFYMLVGHIEDAAKRKQAQESFLYLMA